MSTTNEKTILERKITPVERFFNRSPFSIVSLVSRIQGTVSEEMVRNAVNKVSLRHSHLRYRIVEDENKTPWFTSEGTPEVPVEVFRRESAEDWIKIAQISNQKPFDFENEPAIRILLVQSPDVSELIISCHHILCDGMSLAYLGRDLMEHLGDPNKEVEVLADPVPIQLDNLPEDVSGSGLVNYVIGRMNQKWEEDKIFFDQADYEAINDAYWKNMRHELLSIELSEEGTTALVKKCREESVTVNSAISVAFSGAASLVQGKKDYHDSFVVASNLRDRLKSPVGEGMGMYAGGVEVKHKYNQKASFWENARRFHKKIKKRFTNKVMFNEALTWNTLEPSIIEALNFKKVGGLVSSDHANYKKLSAFSKRDDVVLSILKREKMDILENVFLGTAITNLTRMDFPRKYGELELDRMFLKPGGAFPLSNVNLLVGAVTSSGKLSLVIEYSDKNLDRESILAIKDMALNFLQS